MIGFARLSEAAVLAALVLGDGGAGRRQNADRRRAVHLRRRLLHRPREGLFRQARHRDRDQVFIDGALAVPSMISGWSAARSFSPPGTVPSGATRSGPSCDDSAVETRSDDVLSRDRLPHARRCGGPSLEVLHHVCIEDVDQVQDRVDEPAATTAPLDAHGCADMATEGSEVALGVGDETSGLRGPCPAAPRRPRRVRSQRMPRRRTESGASLSWRTSQLTRVGGRPSRGASRSTRQVMRPARRSAVTWIGATACGMRMAPVRAGLCSTMPWSRACARRAGSACSLRVRTGSTSVPS